MAYIIDHLLAHPVDILQHKEALKVVTNVIFGSSDAQLNILVVPSIDKMINLFKILGKAVEALQTDKESVKSYFDATMCIFKRVGRERTNQVTEAFEKAGGLDLLENFQIHS